MAKKTKRAVSQDFFAWAYVKDGKIVAFEHSRDRAIAGCRVGEHIVCGTATVTVKLPVKKARKQ